MKQRSQMLHSRPMRAPARTLTNAQMRVPSPIACEATSAVGWMEIIGGVSLAAQPAFSEVIGAPLPVEVGGAGEAVAQAHRRFPADEAPDLRDVRDEVAGLLGAALGREL